MRKKILVMAKGEIQEKDISDFYIINYFDYTAQSLAEVQKLAIAKNQTITDAFKEKRILEVEVNDVERTPENIKQASSNKIGIPLRLIDEYEARRIIDFVLENKDKEFIFQCDFGKSRSLTSAYFASRYLLPDHKLIHQNIYIHNKSVFQKLIKAYLFPKKYEKRE